jgi:hypothetical protein
MTNGRTLSWVRETAMVQPGKTWSVPLNSSGLPFHRDVVILDAQNAFANVYNLTARPIDATNEDYLLHRGELKAMLVAAATHVDTDNDKLSDAWEMESYGHLDADASTLAANGESALACYSSGQFPRTPDAQLAPRFQVHSIVGDRIDATFTYRRRLGKAGGLTYAPEISTGLAQWIPAANSFTLESVVNPYDGTGTEIVTLRRIAPLENTPTLWTRLRVFFPAP